MRYAIYDTRRPQSDQRPYLFHNEKYMPIKSTFETKEEAQKQADLMNSVEKLTIYEVRPL